VEFCYGIYLFGFPTNPKNSQDILGLRQIVGILRIILTKEEKSMEYFVRIVEASLFFVLLVVGTVLGLCL
jgi:hypothetical protein